MASPQKEDGFTSLSNELLDKLININISGQQLRAAMFVIRKTYGFNKKDDYISLSQFCKAMNISKTRASQVVTSLQSMKILTVKENINGLTKMYRFNKDYEEWETVKEKRNRIGFTNETVKVLRSRPLRKSVTTKDTSTKERKKEVISHFEWIQNLKINPTYQGIDIDILWGKMVVWCETNHKQTTRRRFVNWLNREDKPIISDDPITAFKRRNNV